MGDVWERLLRDRGYIIQNTLGEGAYSKVKSAYSTRLGRDVAIKCINQIAAPKDFVEKFLPRELQTLPLLRHDNIVRVYEILEASDGYIYIVMESATNGDMLKYVQRKGALTEPEIKKYFWQLCQAVRYCHAKNICHRDLKCENLLLDKNNKLLLTDFGFSKTITYDPSGNASLSSTFCGSAAYAAPEIIQGRPYDPRMHDVWSMGVILYIMTCGHMPFDDSNVRKMLKVQLRNQIQFPPRINETISDRLKSLIRRIIQPDVNVRASLDQIIAHPFFEGYNVAIVSGNKPQSSAGPVGPSHKVAKNIFKFFSGNPPKSSLGTDSNSSNDSDNKQNFRRQLQRKPRDSSAHQRYLEERKANVRREDGSESGRPDPKRFRHPKKDSNY